MEEKLRAAEAELDSLLALYDEKTVKTREALDWANAVHNFYCWRRAECAAALKDLRKYLNSELTLPSAAITPPSETANIDRTSTDVAGQEDVQ